MHCVHLIVIQILILSYLKHYYINDWHLVGCFVVVFEQTELHQNNCKDVANFALSLKLNV
jgi:hypothetical protein